VGDLISVCVAPHRERVAAGIALGRGAGKRVPTSRRFGVRRPEAIANCGRQRIGAGGLAPLPVPTSATRASRRARRARAVATSCSLAARAVIIRRVRSAQDR
jgi:hypothetical protein